MEIWFGTANGWIFFNFQQLSARHHKIVVGYYHFMFLFDWFKKKSILNLHIKINRK